MRLGRIKKATFLVVAKQWELIFCVINTPKFDFVEVEKAMFQVTPCTGNSFPSYWTRQNSTWVMSRRRCIKGSHVSLSSFSASIPSQNANWLRPKIDVSRAHMILSTWVPSAWRHLKHRFLDLNKVEFWGCLEAEKDFKDMNQRFFHFTEIAFSAVHNAGNELSLPCNY